MPEALVMHDDYGRPVRVGRTQEGKPFVSITDGLTSVMAVFGDGRLAEFTELLARAAMPGQVTARVFPCCKCCERERGLTGAGPCVPPRHLTRCVNGCDDAAQAVSG